MSGDYDPYRDMQRMREDAGLPWDCNIEAELLKGVNANLTRENERLKEILRASGDLVSLLLNIAEAEGADDDGLYTAEVEAAQLFKDIGEALGTAEEEHNG